MKKELRNDATSNSGFKKNTGLQYSAAYYTTLTIKDYRHFAELIQSIPKKEVIFLKSQQNSHKNNIKYSSI